MLSFGYNSFWNFMQGSPAVQDLLNKPDLKVEELLEEDGLLLELKTMNQKLLNFLLREENFKQLIYYVIVEPDPEEAKVNQKKGYKYPFVCADVLSSDSQAIVSEFFKSRQDLKETSAVHKAEEAEEQDEVNIDNESLDKDESTEASVAKEEKTTEEGEESPASDANEFPYLNYLFTFLDTETINLTSAGYFAKIVNNLFAKKPSALIAYLYESKPVLLEKMTQHITSKSIAEFLAKVLTFESSILLSNEEEIYNTKRNEILKLIVKKLEPKPDIEEVNNTAYLICEILGKYNTMHCSHEILQNLLERPTIDYFFELLKTKDSTTCCAVALILGNIFAYYILINTPKVQQINEENQENGSQLPPQQLELGEDIPLVSAFISNLGSIVSYIVNTTGKAFSSQYGAEVVPFGSARLKLVELIIIAMKANNKKIFTTLVENEFLEKLLDLFVRYEWNNMLQNQVEKILYIILDSSYEDIKQLLFEKARLLDFLMEASKSTEYTLGGKHERKIRRGYMGQLTKIANRIAESRDPTITQYTENNESWREFLDTQLAEINHRNDIKLGGRDPRGSVEEDDFQDVQGQFPNIMQKFSKYFNPSGKGSNDQKEEEEEEEEEQNDEDLNKAQDEDEDEDEEEDDSNKPREYQNIFSHNDSKKHIIKIGGGGSHHHEETEETSYRGRNSFGYKDTYDEAEEPEQDVIQLENTEVKIPDLKAEEQVLDPEYFSNVIYKRESMHSVDDILKEFEGL